MSERTPTERYGPNAPAILALLERARAMGEADADRLAKAYRAHIAHELPRPIARTHPAITREPSRGLQIANAEHDAARALLHGAAPIRARHAICNAAVGYALADRLGLADVASLCGPWEAVAGALPAAGRQP